jgi:hypothetical protein
VDVPVCRKTCTKPAVERILEFGRELYSMSQRLTVDKNSSETNQKMLEDAFSLLAYSNPWASPVGWQLQPSQRESVCASLNSAILESNKKPRKPPLEVAIAHAHELVKLMSTSGLGSCAFASLIDILDQWPLSSPFCIIMHWLPFSSERRSNWLRQIVQEEEQLTYSQ